jgi:hypothetical protein
MNNATNIPCMGAKNTPLDNRNKAEQENIRGVVINTLYGLSLTQDSLRKGHLSKVGSRILKITTPIVVAYIHQHNSILTGLIRNTNSKP